MDAKIIERVVSFGREVRLTPDATILVRQHGSGRAKIRLMLSPGFGDNLARRRKAGENRKADAEREEVDRMIERGMFEGGLDDGSA